MANGAKSNAIKGSSAVVKVDIKTVNLFFDGTKNNMKNTELYEGFSKKKKIEHNEDETSYSNAYSNIAHLFKNKSKKNNNFWVYIEGMGSTKAKDDDMQGFAFGSDNSGITVRAASAFDAITKEVGNTPHILHINVFGFSRGAATARHFVHLAKSNPKLFKKWKLSKSQVRFKFVGLFDTVSSYQRISKLNILAMPVGAALKAAKPNFNDVSELKLDFRDLDANDKKITKVFHIIAADEYREYFSLTNCNSTLKGKYGYEALMNGAHCDVGGAYKNNSTDSYDIEEEDNRLKEWLIDQGFYTEKHINLVKRGKFKDILLDDYYHAGRSGIKNDIHKISLQMMRRMAEQYGKMTFNSTIKDYEQEITGEVKALMSNIPDDVVNNSKKWGDIKDVTLKESPSTKNLRHKYVHWSARYIKGTEPPRLYRRVIYLSQAAMPDRVKLS